jgi:hypothetical protein
MNPLAVAMLCCASLTLSAAVAAAPGTASRYIGEVLPADCAFLIESRRNRGDDFHRQPTDHIDLCSVPIPTRAPPATDAKR